MRVREGDRTILEARAKAEPAETVTTPDYYTQLPQIRLSADPRSREKRPERATDVTLDDTDVGKLVECAIRHPVLNMRNAVLGAIWNDPATFRLLFRFGLDAPAAFPEIRQIVSEELRKGPRATDADPALAPPASKTLLPRMPLPAHLRNREEK